MKHHISLYIDMLFCLVIMPLAIMMLPVDRWMKDNTAFLITLIAYIYMLYFVYRKACLPKLFMQKKYIHIAILLTVLAGITVLLTHFPLPAEQNAFKYGTSSDIDCTININIKTRDNVLYFETENDIMRTAENNSHGIGIANCRKRLELLYPHHFELHTGEHQGKYKTSLTIKLR